MLGKIFRKAGDGESGTMTQQLGSASVLTAFRQHFSSAARLFRSPARINIIGEHTDYNDGLVMPTNADLHTWVAISPRQDRLVRMHTRNFDELVEVNLDHLQANPGSGWQEYPKGVMQVLQGAGFELTGADILIAGEVPLRSGLSSSAALETGVGYAMLACSGYEVDRARLARMCQAAENDFVGLSCGIMDQFVISTCQRGHAMMLDCRSLETRLAPLPDNARLLVVHSGVHRQLREGGYNERRRECEEANAILARARSGVEALRDVEPEEVDAGRADLGDRLHRRARHVVTEINRVRTAYRALGDGDLGALGQAMSESHASMRDDFEISCQEVDTLVDIAMQSDGVYGSRMVGGGFGGCTVTLVDAAAVHSAAKEIVSRYGESAGRKPWHHVLGPTDPVAEVATE